MNKTFKKIIGMIAVVAVLMTTSCEEQLTTNSSTAVGDDVVLTTTEGLHKILRAAYKNLMFGELTYGAQEAGAYVGIPGFNLYFDDSSSDIMATDNYGYSPEDCYRFASRRTNAGEFGDKIWRMMYLIINQANTLLDNIDKESVLDPQGIRTDLKGQALAMRGICYFYLVMNYQKTYAIAKDKRGVILRTSMEQPMDLGFSTVEETYSQIIKDLTDAKSLLANFDRGSAPEDKWQINADVVSGMLARVYQVKGDWPNALAEASAVYNKYNTLMTKAQWCSGFCDISVPEIIWAVYNVDQYNNGDNTIFCYWHNQDPSYGEGMSDGPIFNFLALFVDQSYVDLFKNDPTDYRGTRCDKTFKEGDPQENHVTDADEKGVMFWHRTRATAKWRDKWAYNKLKYYGDDGKGTPKQRDLADYSIMRSSEMLLIKAEAEAHITPADAVQTLNILQSLRGASLTTTTNPDDLLEEIYVERRKELLGEGVTGMYDFVRLQKDMVRVQESDTNPSGHFSFGMTNLDLVSAGVAKMPSNDYRWFCQIPITEWANNKAIDENSQQNPVSGQ